MSIDVHAYTNPGSRELNEDSYVVRSVPTRCVAVLCDGLGGHNCGEVASQTAAKQIAENLVKLDGLQSEKIYSVIRSANDNLVNMQVTNSEFKGMRTTAVGCILENDNLYYFNSGDSRFYYFSNGTMCNMSKDHSVSQMSVELGEMRFDDIRFDADRNKLLKVLGDNSSGEIATIYKPLKLKSGDAFLLCSDGFWEYVIEEEMEIDLSKSNTAKEWIDYMLVRLLLRFDGKNDNFTVVGGIIK